MKHLRVANEALCDIRRIANYYKRTSGSNHRLLDQLHEATEHLCRFPNSGHRREGLPDESLRCRLIVPYVLIYRVEAEMLVLVGVVHSSRDWARVTEGLYD